MKLLLTYISRMNGSISLAALLFISMAGCNKPLDLKPLDAISDLTLWSDQELVKAYTGNFYAQMTSGFTANTWLIGSITDDGAVPSTSSSARTFSNPTFSASNSPMNSLWTSRFQYIRRANEFLERIDAVPGDAALNKRMKAEIRFMRAYYYFDLVQYFGSVPIITQAQTLNDSLFLPRNSLPECYAFITQELATAADDLPTTYPATDIGRITRQAALALKARTELFAKDWTKAATTAKLVMDMASNSLLTSYDQVFSATNKNNAEILLSVQHNTKFDERGHLFDKNIFSPWYGGSGNNCPTQNLVDEYEMKATGLPITNALSGYDPTKPYIGRDARFYSTVLHDSALFKSRRMQMYTGGEDITAGGPNGVLSSAITTTGYYLKKFSDESYNPFGDPNARSSQNWIIIRYAEVLLIYAEAQNEAAGPDATVYAAINAIRARATMPSLPTGLSQAEMRSAIRHERRIELAFEDHRYWDVKRWGLATTLFAGSSNPLKKVVITRNAVTGIKTYTYAGISGDNRVFLDKHYLFPIPQTELNKAGNKLTQNPGW
jgi:starch-binding outer membrane protein, SusD/RagB family